MYFDRALLSAVEYIQANRARSIAIQQMAAIFKIVDIIVIPSDGNSSRSPISPGIRPYPAQRHSRERFTKPPAVDTGDEDNIGGPGTPVSIIFSAICIRMQSSAPSRAPTSTLPISPRCIPIYPASAFDGSERRAAHSEPSCGLSGSLSEPAISGKLVDGVHVPRRPIFAAGSFSLELPWPSG